MVNGGRKVDDLWWVYRSASVLFMMMIYRVQENGRGSTTAGSRGKLMKKFCQQAGSVIGNSHAKFHQNWSIV